MEERKRRRSPRTEPSEEPREAALEPRREREGAASREATGARRARVGEVSLSPEGEASTATLEPQERPMLEVDNLAKIYGSRTVVDGVSFTVRSGEIIGLLGKNGAGKTTTFRMTIGMIQADEGTIRFSGRDVTRLPMYKRARLGMGYLSQESSVFRGLTVEENLNAILETTGWSSSERVRKRDELVEEFGLGRLLHSKAAVLSGGEKRRLEIARALITEPTLILLDEPFSGVDPIAVSDIQQIIFRLRERGIGILLTDHNVRETLSTTDRSFIILDGKIIAQGNREEILSNQYARKYYLGESFTM
jgi:lipopolysaccharide export system ATP-binding protein